MTTLDDRGLRAMRESYATTIAGLAHRLAEAEAAAAQTNDQERDQDGQED